jgi:hypothetical protein
MLQVIVSAKAAYSHFDEPVNLARLDPRGICTDTMAYGDVGHTCYQSSEVMIPTIGQKPRNLAYPTITSELMLIILT